MRRSDGTLRTVWCDSTFTTFVDYSSPPDGSMCPTHVVRNNLPCPLPCPALATTPPHTPPDPSSPTRQFMITYSIPCPCPCITKSSTTTASPFPKPLSFTRTLLGIGDGNEGRGVRTV
ncbi:hypothetical protein BO71DRAFT_173513 [Aspergillus ellipticus CBS 707.79]|uniref:Uncharacterized protein n=1 Tax=Aspergillus ellipticus CBS 707.79 TaxID=1448320 RepID=A0A319EXM4_9EURO|nr:hypothetical protein BO71DRAFT_173513 [Aspergillus ellipticus CBS 707.79]